MKPAQHRMNVLISALLLVGGLVVAVCGLVVTEDITLLAFGLIVALLGLAFLLTAFGFLRERDDRNSFGRLTSKLGERLNRFGRRNSNEKK